MAAYLSLRVTFNNLLQFSYHRTVQSSVKYVPFALSSIRHVSFASLRMFRVSLVHIGHCQFRCKFQIRYSNLVCLEWGHQSYNFFAPRRIPSVLLFAYLIDGHNIVLSLAPFTFSTSTFSVFDVRHFLTFSFP